MSEMSLQERMLIEAGLIPKIRADGGPGSGNFGHKGVPGQKGGSAPKDGGGSSESEGSSGESSGNSNYTSGEKSAVSYWVTGNDGWGYSNIRAIANGAKAPSVEKAIKSGNIEKAQYLQDEFEQMQRDFDSAVQKSPSPDGKTLMRITGSFSEPSVGDTIELRKYESFSSEPTSSMLDNLGSEGSVIYRVGGDDRFAEISGIANKEVNESEAISREQLTCSVEKVGRETIHGKEYVVADLKIEKEEKKEATHRNIEKECPAKSSSSDKYARIMKGFGFTDQMIKEATEEGTAEAAYKMLMSLARNAEKDSAEEERNDGGPGSGNFGHKGVPGQVGGSAPNNKEKSSESSSSGKSDKNYSMSSRPGTPKQQMNQTLLELGHKQEDIDKMRSLFAEHSGNNRDRQNEADEEIMRHIRDNDSIGKLLKDKALVEEQSWKEQQEAEKKRLEKDYNFKVWIAEQDLAPGGVYENYTKEELQDMNVWPTKKEYHEPRLVRVGTMDRDTLSFSTNPDGAGSFKTEYAEPGTIHEYTMSDLSKMGYRPIGGIASMDVGQSDDYEVLFAKFSDSDKKDGYESDGGPRFR